MTPHEFKAWFEGFTERLDERPTAKQWARIKERVKEIDGKQTMEYVYLNRYVAPIQHFTASCGSSLASAAANSTVLLRAQSQAAQLGSNGFDASSAMYRLGQAGAKGEA